MSFLVRAPNWLGDAVMSLPALEALHTLADGRPLVALARPAVADVWRMSGYCDEVIVLPSPKGKGWRATLAASAALRQRRFETGIVFPNSFESALGLRLSGARQRLGYRNDGRSLLLTKAVPRPKPGEIPRHEVYYYLELLRRLGMLPELPPDASPRLRLSDAVQAKGRALLDQHGLGERIIAVNPGAANSRAKQWPPERFVLAATQVAREMQAEIAVFGTPQERDLCEGIAADIANAGCSVYNLAGATSLADFIAAVSQCVVLLTNDSGGMHVAAACGVPTVAIFGPTIEQETGPLGPHTRVVREPVECSQCMLKDCPIDHRCMTRVTPERVADEAVGLVQIT
jgi:heptosyltransferase II